MVDAPSGGAPEHAPRWDLVDTESCGNGIRFLALSSIVCGYMDIYIGGRSMSVERQGAHEVGGRAQGGAPSTLVTASCTSWSRVQVSWITFGWKITIPKVSFHLDSV